MKFVFLNLWNCNNDDSAKDFIKQQVETTDVFCFQEAYEKAKGLLQDILKDYIVYTDYKYLSDKENFSQATYIKKSVGVVLHETLLMDTPAAGLALYSHLRLGEADVHLCNVHGVSKPGDKLDNDIRIAQSRALLDSLKDLSGTKIVGGDFNLEMDTESIQMFEVRDYRNLVREGHILTTRNKYAWERYPDSKQYYSDYVFVSKEASVKEFSVPDSEASDHLPLILVI